MAKEKIEQALSEVEEKSVEYSAAVQYGEIGDVHNEIHTQKSQSGETHLAFE